LPYVGLEHVEKERGHFADGFVPTPLNMLATNFRFTPKHVLYGKLRPYLNKVVLPNFDGVCTTEILPILPNEEKLDRTFLWAILLSPTFVNWATSQISGANLPRLDPKLLAEYEIPLPPLTEQKRIASLLARADRLRQLRRTAHDLGDALLQSVFLEMFGDIKTNSKNWDMCIIDDVVEFSQYGTSEKSNSEKRGYPVLGMPNITYEGKLDLEKLSYVDLSEKEFTQLRHDRKITFPFCGYACAE
jgi:type I restriction enzyme S subunit